MWRPPNNQMGSPFGRPPKQDQAPLSASKQASASGLKLEPYGPYGPGTTMKNAAGLPVGSLGHQAMTPEGPYGPGFEMKPYGPYGPEQSATGQVNAAAAEAAAGRKSGAAQVTEARMTKLRGDLVAGFKGTPQQDFTPRVDPHVPIKVPQGPYQAPKYVPRKFEPRKFVPHKYTPRTMAVAKAEQAAAWARATGAPAPTTAAPGQAPKRASSPEAGNFQTSSKSGSPANRRGDIPQFKRHTKDTLLHPDRANQLVNVCNSVLHATGDEFVDVKVTEGNITITMTELAKTVLEAAPGGGGGISFKGEWSDASVDYIVGDVVILTAVATIQNSQDTGTYYCVQAHTSSADIRPPQGEDINNSYWWLLGRSRYEHFWSYDGTDATTQAAGNTHIHGGDVVIDFGERTNLTATGDNAELRLDADTLTGAELETLKGKTIKPILVNICVDNVAKQMWVLGTEPFEPPA